ncbi:glycosyltransferase [Enterovibrio makurazakiensis]|uniref:glycosyltransferase n=1 Tax=Enterovibrio makurazakiensis TaxID=2910232 RepID=UPI003D1B19F3
MTNKVLLCHSTIAGNGATISVLIEQANFFAGLDYEVEVITFSGSKDSRFDERVKVTNINSLSKINIIDSSVSVLSLIGKKITTRLPDLVTSYIFKPFSRVNFVFNSDKDLVSKVYSAFNYKIIENYCDGSISSIQKYYKKFKRRDLRFKNGRLNYVSYYEFGVKTKTNYYNGIGLKYLEKIWNREEIEVSRTQFTNSGLISKILKKHNGQCVQEEKFKGFFRELVVTKNLGEDVGTCNYIVKSNILNRYIESRYGEGDAIISVNQTMLHYISTLKTKATTIGQVHNSWLSQGSEYMASFEFAIKSSFRLNRTVFLTSGALEYIKGNYGVRNGIVIPNAISDVEKKFTPFEEKLMLDEIKLVIVARLTDIKQIDHAIKAFSLAIKENSRLRLYIYGEGPSRGKLEKLARELEVSEFVFFMGYESNKDQIYSDKSLLICTSKAESFGMTLVEANSYGVPCLSYDCPYGPRDIIRDGSGILVDLNDITELTNQILNPLLYTKRYSNESLVNADRFLKKKIYTEYEKIIEKGTN